LYCISVPPVLGQIASNALNRLIDNYNSQPFSLSVHVSTKCGTFECVVENIPSFCKLTLLLFCCNLLKFNAPHPPMVSTRYYMNQYWNNRKKLFVSKSIKDSLEESAYKDFEDGDDARRNLAKTPQQIREREKARDAIKDAKRSQYEGPRKPEWIAELTVRLSTIKGCCFSKCVDET